MIAKIKGIVCNLARMIKFTLGKGKTDIILNTKTCWIDHNQCYDIAYMRVIDIIFFHFYLAP